MRLTLYSDYSLRVLIYLGLNADRLCSIEEIAAAYGISRNHLVKVVHNLATLGVVRTTRGRRGGIALASDPASLTLGSVVRKTERANTLVECFDDDSNTCRLTHCCHLKHLLADAQEAFFSTLDRHTLAEVLARPKAMKSLLQVNLPPRKSHQTS